MRFGSFCFGVGKCGSFLKKPKRSSDGLAGDGVVDGGEREDGLINDNGSLDNEKLNRSNARPQQYD